MRLLLIALVLSLSACAPIVAPLPRQESELLYRVLTLHIMIKDSLLKITEQTSTGEMTDDELFAAAFGTTRLVRTSYDLLSEEYPASLSAPVAIAKEQHDTLRTVMARWVEKREIFPHDFPAELQDVDPTSVREQYIDLLLARGYSQDDIQAMNDRLRADLQEALVIP